MFPELILTSTMFTTLTAGIQLFSSVTSFMLIQILLCCIPFVTHRTHIRPWLAIMWMLSDIITISFNLNFKGSFTCIIYKYTTRDIIQSKQTVSIINMLENFTTDSNNYYVAVAVPWATLRLAHPSVCPSVLHGLITQKHSAWSESRWVLSILCRSIACTH